MSDAKPYTDDYLAALRDWPGGSVIDNERRRWLAAVDALRAERDEACAEVARLRTVESAARTLLVTRGVQLAGGVSVQVVDDTAARHLEDAIEAAAKGGSDGR